MFVREKNISISTKKNLHSKTSLYKQSCLSQGKCNIIEEIIHNNNVNSLKTRKTESVFDHKVLR